MPEQISYVRCDCKKGKLEEIASTEISWGFACGDGGDQTLYYGCNSCSNIYARERSIPGYPGEDHFSDYQPYEGKLTKEELINNAKKHFGNIYPWEEKKIIKKRK